MWIGEVAKRAGVNRQTLRYYERRGILPTPERTPGGYRDYPGWTVNLIRFIKDAQNAGYSLPDIELLLQLGDGTAASCADARAITASRVAELDRRIAELRRMRDFLTKGLACQGPGPGRSCRVMMQTVADIDPSGVSQHYETCTCPLA